MCCGLSHLISTESQYVTSLILWLLLYWYECLQECACLVACAKLLKLCEFIFLKDTIDKYDPFLCFLGRGIRKLNYRDSFVIKKWPLPVRENLDVMSKNGCDFRIPRPKKNIWNGYTRQLCASVFTSRPLGAGRYTNYIVSVLVC